mmetsp:Transcript_45189/g.125318  ORF Transcript_45189/g.125318 Transcript_45189/m.125318 type:complete len:230 (-) Transcript_45189:59-748(-)
MSLLRCIGGLGRRHRLGGCSRGLGCCGRGLGRRRLDRRRRAEFVWQCVRHVAHDLRHTRVKLATEDAFGLAVLGRGRQAVDAVPRRADHAAALQHAAAEVLQVLAEEGRRLAVERRLAQVLERARPAGDEDGDKVVGPQLEERGHLLARRFEHRQPRLVLVCLRLLGDRRLHRKLVGLRRTTLRVAQHDAEIGGAERLRGERHARQLELAAAHDDEGLRLVGRHLLLAP